jgi:hypothetical protein
LSLQVFSAPRPEARQKKIFGDLCPFYLKIERQAGYTGKDCKREGYGEIRDSIAIPGHNVGSI